MKRKITRSLAVAGFAALGLATGVVAAPSASADELPGCAIWAEKPYEGAGIIAGVAYRDGCAQDRTITVRIRKDISLWPDETVVSKTWSGVVNGRFVVSWDCPRGAGGNFFTEILTSAGGKASSARRNLYCSA
jgi:hypothetical protein